MKLRTPLAVLAISTFALAVGLAPTTGNLGQAPTALADPPGGGGGGGGEPLMWSDYVPSTWTWSAANDIADTWDEGGYTDWRLATIDEIMAALDDGSWGECGRVVWTSEHKGKRFAYAVKTCEQEAIKILQESYIGVRFVRP